MSDVQIKKITNYLYEIPKHGKMRVPGRIYANKDILQNIYQDESFKQVINVAELPGIINYSLAMPDIHWGYGFPIGGVAAMDINEGIITPGGIGFDINCGVRLVKTGLLHNKISRKLKTLINKLFQEIPSGVGNKSKLRLKDRDFEKLLTKGAKWAVGNGYGSKDDLDYIEENGQLEGADVNVLSSRAIERGRQQIGTLGAGNHFVEIDIIDEIYDEQAANILGLEKNQIMLQIHTGSRGFGHQVCNDYIKIMMKALNKYHIEVSDKQLCCAPINSPEGQSYYSAMACAANFAFVNRQIIKDTAEKVFLKTLSISPNELDFTLIYDICHNIGKFEEHEIDGKIQKVFVHRKGATRAFGPGHSSLPKMYKSMGQPVLIPGDMGRYSFLLKGTSKAMTDTFGSSCHGAGREMSRSKALRLSKGRDLFKEIQDKGIALAVKKEKTLAEEMPDAYKDVANVVDVMSNSGISKKILRLKPVGVMKG